MRRVVFVRNGVVYLDSQYEDRSEALLIKQNVITRVLA